MSFSWKTTEDGSASALISQILPWVLLAGDPYYSWLFGDAQHAMQVLNTWMARPSSEVSVLRAQLLARDNEIAGGLIALSGTDLKKARKADFIALLTGVSSVDRQQFIYRLAVARKIFSPVDDDEYYLSKIGVNPPFRRMGCGQMLLERFIHEGNARGYTRFRLDVHAGNVEAIRLYQRAGFETAQAHSTDSPLNYYCMTRRG
jgi:ribosomal protein S18 acetylase RimI-like enzyme